MMRLDAALRKYAVPTPPSSPRAAQPLRRRPGVNFLIALSILASLALGALAFVQLRNRGPERVLVIRAGGPDLDVFQAEALSVFLQDHLEALGAPPTGLLPALPDGPRLAELGERTLVVQPIARRHGSALGLELRQAWSGALRRGKPAWRGTVIPPGPPAQVLREALQDLPLRLRSSEGLRMMPREPGGFWDLIRAQGWHRFQPRLGEAQLLTERLLQSEPDCTTGWLVYGDILYRRLLSDPKSLSGVRESAESALASVLKRVPGHPRAAFLLSELHTDSGNQRDALEALREAQRHNPRAIAIYAGIAYAARTSGLLDLARRAADRSNQLLPRIHSGFAAENTYLYLGDLAAFEHSLQERPNTPRDATILFYRGYLALARGQKEKARAWFQQAANQETGLGEFRLLSRAFGHIAAGEDLQALEALQHLERQRTGLRIPDGEFTFKMAEAHALLGRREASLDLLTRSFAQGFGCARWYRESPFLLSVRKAPRWPSLLARVEERQQLFSNRFTPRAFGL